MVEFELWVPSGFEFAGSGADGSSVTVVLAAAEVRIEVRGWRRQACFFNPTAYCSQLRKHFQLVQFDSIVMKNSLTNNTKHRTHVDYVTKHEPSTASNKQSLQ